MIEGAESSVRIEQRDGSSDANPYLLLGCQLAAGIDGIENDRDPGEPTLGNGYAVTEAEPLPSDIPTALERFKGSQLISDIIPEMLRTTLAQQAEREQQFMMDSGEANPAETVTGVERARYLESF